MKVHLREILADGLSLTFTGKDEWIVNVIQDVLPDGQAAVDSTIHCRCHLILVGDIVHLSGQISFERRSSCARCAKDLILPVVQDLQVTLAPVPQVKGGVRANQEIELKASDLDENFYHHDEIDLDTVLTNEIAMGLPFTDECGAADCTVPATTDSHVSLGGSGSLVWDQLKVLKSVPKS